MGNVKIVVPVSGGKDSQACLKLALSIYPAHQVRGLFCDTKWEHPKTYAHVEKLRTLYGEVQIDVVNAGSVEDQCIKHGRFPSQIARFCTEELKIWPTKKYLKALAEQQGSFIARKRDSEERKTASKLGGVEVWYGMRVDESTERRTRYAGKVCDDLYAPNDVMKKYPKYLEKLGVMFRLAVLSWSEHDVFDYLEGQHNPLYDEDFDRVGCFPCCASGDKPKEKAFNHDEFGKQQYQKIIVISRAIGKNIFTSKGGKKRHENDLDLPGCALCSI